MVAEVLERDYTRIGNRLIRDGRLDWPPKGVFMWMASHKDGFGVSPESIAAAGPGGVSAAKSALRQLEKHGYLIRRRERRTDGTLGPSTYFITDMPEDAPGQQSPRSQPRVENPPVVQPPQVEPPVADDPHKKTNPMQEDQLVEDQLSLPAQRPQPHPVSDEREIAASNDQPSTAQRVVRTAGVVTADEEESFIAWTTAKHQPRSSAWWRTVAQNGDLPDLAADWRAQGGLDATQPLTGADATAAGWFQLADQLGGRQPHQPYSNDPWHHLAAQAAAGSRPDGWERVAYCGHLDCDEVTRMKQVDIGNGLKSLTYCSACHPALQF
jgi:hypothetical protein